MSRKRRERWDLGEGAYMDISIDPNASPETIAALRALGEATVQRMADSSVAADISRRDCWWTIHGPRLVELLRRAHDGEDPDTLYAQEYLSADSEEI